MAKGDDVVRRKKSKANRKKLNDSSNVSTRLAAMIAAKTRRKCGKRRICEGMCFSLPTPDDPFNDRHGKKDFKLKDFVKKETKKVFPCQVDEKLSTKGKSEFSSKGTLRRNNTKLDHLDQKNENIMSSKNKQRESLTSINVGQRNVVDQGMEENNQEEACENAECPSKFLILCLNAIQNSLCQDGSCNREEEMPLFVNTWGVEFWKSWSAGKDILETSGSSSTVGQIAWIVSTAADTIARKEKEGLSFTNPFLLYLVPSQEKAIKVRSVCRPLKALGVHTVSLHNGASLDHQITGLKSCEPEFLVSTPERLLELVSLKAIDISRVSSLVVDGVASLVEGCYLDTIKSIRQSISGNPHTVVFNDCSSHASILAAQNLLMGSVGRLSLNDSAACQSACIIHSVNVATSEEEEELN